MYSRRNPAVKQIPCWAVTSTRVLCLSPTEIQGLRIPSDGATTIAVAGSAGGSMKSSALLSWCSSMSISHLFHGKPWHPDHFAVLSALLITRSTSIILLLPPRWILQCRLCAPRSFPTLLISMHSLREGAAIRDSQRSAAIWNTEIHFCSSASRSPALQANPDFKSQRPFRTELSIHQ